VPTLEQIDTVRERTGCSYRQAKMALEQHDDDVIEAIIYLEGQKNTRADWAEYASVKGSELVEQLRRLVQQGNVRRVRVLHDDKVLVEFPVTAGALGALLAPKLAAVGVIAALLTRCTIEVIRADEPPNPTTN
jgi:hypothetical protein